MSDEKNINESVHYEGKTTNFRALAWIGAGIIFGAVLMHFFLYLLYLDFTNPSARAERSPATFVQRSEPALSVPRLQDKPAADLNELRERENEKLNSYGWIDRERGIVRIPIERAMNKILQNGLPDTNQASANTNQANQTPK